MATIRRNLVTVKEAAERIGVKLNTFRNWLRDGKIPYYILEHNMYRIAIEELDAWVRERKPVKKPKAPEPQAQVWQGRPKPRGIKLLGDGANPIIGRVSERL